jgi:hypothetical protein
MGQLLPVQQLVRSAHQCLIAEISFDPVPIPANTDPSTSDKLAQRNLTFVNVPNPGLIESRRAPQTFEVRPTPPQFPGDLPPDEMMIDWGRIPAGTSANIYLPAAAADEILALADQQYDAHRLTKVDDSTLACPSEGVTFIPLPRSSAPNFAGLLTVDLPPGIRKGDVHDVTVRQVTTALARLPERLTRGEEEAPPRVADDTSSDADGEPSEAPPALMVTKSFAGKRTDIAWRRVLGVFKVTIPVATKAELLAPEARLLSILRWIQTAIPLDSRWFLVFQRYVDQVAGRVLDMGGDPDEVSADANGDWQHKIKTRPHGHHGHQHDQDDDQDDEDEGGHQTGGERLVRCTGKIASLAYDRYGAYSGFLLDTEDGLRRFEGREAEMESLAERAWHERTTISVYAERHDRDRPLKIVLHAPSAALED